MIGAGAIGAFYGGVLARGGCEVSVVARSDYEVVAREGYRIASRLGDLSFRPKRVLRQAEPGCDFVLMAVKLVRDVDRVALLQPALARGTVIVLIANGIDVEDELAQAFPSHELLSGVAYAGVSREAPGRIRHRSPFTRLVIGSHPSGTSAACLRFAEMVRAGGSSAQATEDIVLARWQKCAWNTVFNPLSALGGGLGTRDILGADASVRFVREAIAEVCAIARAAGHALAEDTVDKQISGTQRMGNYLSSMGQDALAGRPMETEPLLGNALRAARRLSVPAPRLESLYALLLMLERKASAASDPPDRAGAA